MGYVALTIVSEFQKEIMVFVDEWARVERTPIPLKAIRDKFPHKKTYTIKNAINKLIKKGYIRRAVRSRESRMSYVQLRRL